MADLVHSTELLSFHEASGLFRYAEHLMKTGRLRGYSATACDGLVAITPDGMTLGELRLQYALLDQSVSGAAAIRDSGTPI